MVRKKVLVTILGCAVIMFGSIGISSVLVQQKIKLLDALNPEKVLRQGYAILSGKISPGNVVKITTYREEIDAEIKKVKERKKNG